MLEAPFSFAPKLFRGKSALCGGQCSSHRMGLAMLLERRYAMSFLMRSMASTVASASPKAVRRT